jgi:isopenicillin N synthase-like dioxygenase
VYRQAGGLSYKNVGFLVISNHCIPQSLINQAFSVSRGFSDLPNDPKGLSKAANELSPRGYHAPATRNLARTLGQETPPDLREQFFVAR